MHPIKDTATVEKVEFPKEGGVFTYLKGHKYPYPGFPHQRVVEKVSLVKSFIPAILELIKLIPLRRITGAIKVAKRIIKGAYYVLRDEEIQPNRYSKPVREIRRLFNILIEREKNKDKKAIWKHLRTVICMILEFDNAYRFRLQDVLKEINIDEIKPTEGDKYYMSLHNDFDWDGKEKKKLQNS